MASARRQSLVSHTHDDGVMGAVLQAAAVWKALQSEGGIDPETFAMDMCAIVRAAVDVSDACKR